MKPWLKENWFKASIIIVLLLAGFSLFYYFVVFLPQREQKLDEARKLSSESLEICLKQAEEERETFNACRALGTVTPEDLARQTQEAREKILSSLSRCPQQALDGMALTDYLKDQKDECFRKYPQN